MVNTESTNRVIRCLGLLAYVTTILYVIEQFVHHPMIELSYSLFAAILLISAFFVVPNVTRWVVIVLLLIGSICFYLEGTPIANIIAGFGKNTNILALFLLVPLIGTFLSTAGYLSALKEKVQEREEQKERHPYRLSFLLTMFTGIILNFAAMAIVKKISDESLSSFRNKKMSLIIMRGFGFCMLWSPYFVNVGLVLVIFNLSWFDIGGYGLVLAIIYLFVNWVLFNKIDFQDDPVLLKEQHERDTKSTATLTPFYLFSIILIFLSFLLDYLLPVNMITVVSLLAVLFPFVWAGAIKVTRYYIHDVAALIEQSFYRVKNELAVFISAGFFGAALSQTEIGGSISMLLFDVSFGSVYLLSWVIVLLAIGLAQIGIHPVIIVIGIGSALSPENFGVSAEYMALLLVIAWSLATQISPFSGQVLMASRLMDQPPSVLIKQNYTLTFTLSVIFITVIYGFFIIGWL